MPQPKKIAYSFRLLQKLRKKKKKLPLRNIWVTHARWVACGLEDALFHNDSRASYSQRSAGWITFNCTCDTRDVDVMGKLTRIWEGMRLLVAIFLFFPYLQTVFFSMKDMLFTGVAVFFSRVKSRGGKWEFLLQLCACSMTPEYSSEVNEAQKSESERHKVVESEVWIRKFVILCKKISNFFFTCTTWKYDIEDWQTRQKEWQRSAWWR